MYIFTMLCSQLTLSLIPPSHTAEYVLCAWSVLWALYSHFHYHNPIQCMERVNHTLFPSTAELMNICFTNAKWNRVSLLFAIHYNVYNPTDNAPKAFHIVAIASGDFTALHKQRWSEFISARIPKTRASMLHFINYNTPQEAA